MLKRVCTVVIILMMGLSTLVLAQGETNITGETKTIYQDYEFDGDKVYHGKDASQLWWGSYADEIVRNYWIDYDDSVDVDDKFKQKTNFDINTEVSNIKLGLELGLDNDFNSGDNNFNVDDENKDFELEKARVYLENDNFSMQAGDLTDYTISDYLFNDEDLENAVEVEGRFSNFRVKALYGEEKNYGEVVEVFGDPDHYSDAVKYQDDLAALMSDPDVLGQLFIRKQFNLLSVSEQQAILGAIETALASDPSNTDLLQLQGLLAPIFTADENIKVGIIINQLRLSNNINTVGALKGGVNDQIGNINDSLDLISGNSLTHIPQINFAANNFNQSNINVYDTEADLTTYYKMVEVGSDLAGYEMTVRAVDVSDRIRTLMNGSLEGDTTYSFGIKKAVKDNLTISSEYASNEGDLFRVGAELSLFEGFTTISGDIRRIDKDFDLVREDDGIFEKNIDDQGVEKDTTEYNLKVNQLPIIVPVLFGEADLTYDDELTAKGGLTYVAIKDELFLQTKYTYEGDDELADVLETGAMYTPNDKLNLTLAAGRKFDYQDFWIDTEESADIDDPVDYRRKVDVSLVTLNLNYKFTPCLAIDLTTSKLYDEEDNEGVELKSEISYQF